METGVIVRLRGTTEEKRGPVSRVLGENEGPGQDGRGLQGDPDAWKELTPQVPRGGNIPVYKYRGVKTSHSTHKTNRNTETPDPTNSTSQTTNPLLGLSLFTECGPGQRIIDMFSELKDSDKVVDAVPHEGSSYHRP